MYVSGEWRSGAATDMILNPYDGEAVGEAAAAELSDAEDALDAAVAGAAEMRGLSAFQRSEILERAADLSDERVEDLALTIARETGKTIAEARLEAGRAGVILRLSAAAGARLHGEGLPLSAAPGGEGKIGFTLRQPCGIVVAISPFNFPSLLSLHKVGPALAAGNAVIHKPARQTPLTAIKLCEILLDAGLPPLGLQVLTGSGSILGPALCSDERVRKISFTGSTEVGREITQIAGIKRLSLELGSACPLIVLPDANPEDVAAAVAKGAFANAGQVCISLQRVIVDSSIHGDLVDALVPAVEAIQLGDPLEDGTEMGSLISSEEAERVERSIADAVEQGAQLVTGGERDGARMKPAVLDGVSGTAPFATEELFGPAVALSAVETVEEAIAEANRGPYGLAAGIFTNDINSAMRFAQEVDAGVLQINWTPLWRADLLPYGGLKASGFGKEGPDRAVEEMTEEKAVVIHGVGA